MDKDKKLNRNITITELLKSDERKKYESEYTICIGIFDNTGLESIIEQKWKSADDLGNLTSSLHRLSLRARFNSHREIGRAHV